MIRKTKTGSSFNGSILKSARIKANLTQEEVAQQLHIGKGVYCDYENGKHTPRADRLSEIAKLFNVTEAQLLGLSEDTSAVPEEIRTSGLFSEDTWNNFVNAFRLIEGPETQSITGMLEVLLNSEHLPSILEQLGSTYDQYFKPVDHKEQMTMEVHRNQYLLDNMPEGLKEQLENASLYEPLQQYMSQTDLFTIRLPDSKTEHLKAMVKLEAMKCAEVIEEAIEVALKKRIRDIEKECK